MLHFAHTTPPGPPSFPLRPASFKPTDTDPRFLDDLHAVDQSRFAQRLAEVAEDRDRRDGVVQEDHQVNVAVGSGHTRAQQHPALSSTRVVAQHAGSQANLVGR